MLTVAEEMLGSVVKALSEVDAQTPLVEALMTAHAAVVADITNDTGPVNVGPHAPDGQGDHVVAGSAEEGRRTACRNAHERACRPLRDVRVGYARPAG